jgi:hypothetical protein
MAGASSLKVPPCHRSVNRFTERRIEPVIRNIRYADFVFALKVVDIANPVESGEGILDLRESLSPPARK